MSALRIATATCLTLYALAGCTGSEEPAGSEPGVVAGATASASESPGDGSGGLPATPVGTALASVLRELRAGPLEESDYRRLFAAPFRHRVRLDQLNQLAGTDVAVERVRVGSAPNYLTATARVTGLGDAVVIAGTTTGGGHPRLSLFAITPATPPAVDAPVRLDRWARVDRQVAGLAPVVALQAAEVTAAGCRPVHGLEAAAAMPLGSTMKLWVLGELARETATDRLDWTEELTLTDEQRTLPAGVLQDTRGRVRVPVRDAAGLMMSLSDNTATDMLVDRLRAERVRRYAVGLGASQPESLTPYLDIAQLFALRLNDYPRLARRYQEASPRQRRKLLASAPVLRDPSAAELSAWTAPRWRGGPGWRGSAADLCVAWASLDAAQGEDAEQVDQVLSLNDGGLRLDRGQWPRLWFKGGSEPGVLVLSFLAEHEDGRVFVTSLLLADARRPLREPTVVPAALDAVRAGFALAAQGR